MNNNIDENHIPFIFPSELQSDIEKVEAEDNSNLSKVAKNLMLIIKSTEKTQHISLQNRLSLKKQIHDLEQLLFEEKTDSSKDKIKIMFHAAQSIDKWISENSSIQLKESGQKVKNQLDPKTQKTLKAIEKQIEQSVTELRENEEVFLLGNDNKLDDFGNKHKNLVKLAQLIQVINLDQVNGPLPVGVSSQTIEAFLSKNIPDLDLMWKQLSEMLKAHNTTTPFLEETDARKILTEIDLKIQSAFAEEPDIASALNLGEAFHEWLESMSKQGNYLMVRSTGAEDSRLLANAGGNKSCSYVDPDIKSFSNAVSEVVRSYFGSASLQNRINGETNPFEEPLKVAVTAQELIGEKINGTEDDQQVPKSLVLFTNEPLFVGGEEFRVMRVSGTFGHGEGVVAGEGIASDSVLLLSSVTTPGKLYIQYDAQIKPERLAPVQEGQVVSLAPINNSKALQKTKVFSDENLERLWQIGIIVEKYFEYENGCDMELVIKGDCINIVQARSINRPEVIPTYLNLKGLKQNNLKPIEKTIKGLILVPGTASVVRCTDESQILRAPTLAQAETLFQKNIHKIVIAGQPEPHNSHPVVNFSSMGVPCLYIRDQHQTESVCGKINDSMEVVACTQNGSLNLWNFDTAPLENYVANGYIVHPAQLALSLPVDPEEGFEHEVDSVPQEILDLLEQVRIAVTTEAAKTALEQLQENQLIKELKNNQKKLENDTIEQKFSPFIKRKISYIKEATQALDIKTKESFDQLTVLLNFPERRLEGLFHAKVLETLIAGPSIPTYDGINQYSIASSSSLFKVAESLLEYQRNLPFPAKLADIYISGLATPFKETKNEWHQFLMGLEFEASSLENEIDALRRIIAMLQSTDSLPLFMTLFFPRIYQEDSVGTLKSLIQMAPEKDKPLMRDLSARKKSIARMVNKTRQLTQSSDFEELALLLENELDLWIPKEGDSISSLLLKENWMKASPIIKSIALACMNEVIALQDRAIKSMKMSKGFSEKERTACFKQMINPYLNLLENWLQNLSEFKDKAYLIALRDQYDACDDQNPKQLFPYPGFNVIAASYSAKTNFKRHLPQHLEDIFTLTHQNLLQLTGELSQQLGSLPNPPKLFEQAISKLPTIAQKGRNIGDPICIGLVAERNSVSLKFNIPLMNHSALLNLNYNGKTEELSTVLTFVGVDKKRWISISDMAICADEAQLFHLKTRPVVEKESVTIETIIDSDKDIHNIYNFVAEASLGTFILGFNFSESLIKLLDEKQILSIADSFVLSEVDENDFKGVIFDAAFEVISKEPSSNARNNKIVSFITKGSNRMRYQELLSLFGKDNSTSTQGKLTNLLSQNLNKEQFNTIDLLPESAWFHFYNLEPVHQMAESLCKKPEGVHHLISIATKLRDSDAGKELWKILLKNGVSGEVIAKKIFSHKSVKTNNSCVLLAPLLPEYSNMAIKTAFEAINDKDPEVRARAIKLASIMALSTPTPKDLIPFIEAGLRDENKKVKEETILLINTVLNRGESLEGIESYISKMILDRSFAPSQKKTLYHIYGELLKKCPQNNLSIIAGNCGLEILKQTSKSLISQNRNKEIITLINGAMKNNPSKKDVATIEDCIHSIIHNEEFSEDLSKIGAAFLKIPIYTEAGKRIIKSLIGKNKGWIETIDIPELLPVTEEAALKAVKNGDSEKAIFFARALIKKSYNKENSLEFITNLLKYSFSKELINDIIKNIPNTIIVRNKDLCEILITKGFGKEVIEYAIANENTNILPFLQQSIELYEDSFIIESTVKSLQSNSSWIQEQGQKILNQLCENNENKESVYSIINGLVISEKETGAQVVKLWPVLKKQIEKGKLIPLTCSLILTAQEQGENIPILSEVI